ERWTEVIAQDHARGADGTERAAQIVRHAISEAFELFDGGFELGGAHGNSMGQFSFDPLLFVDVDRDAEPTHDLAVSILHRRRAAKMPAVFAVPSLQADLAFKGHAGFDRFPPF